MDFLLAVIVYAVWYELKTFAASFTGLTSGDRDRHRGHHESILSNLVQQAVAIVYHLGLHATLPNDPGLALMYDLRGIPRPPRLTRTETLEERRALLACYILSSGYVLIPSL